MLYYNWIIIYINVEAMYAINYELHFGWQNTLSENASSSDLMFDSLFYNRRYIIKPINFIENIYQKTVYMGSIANID